MNLSSYKLDKMFSHLALVFKKSVYFKFKISKYVSQSILRGENILLQTIRFLSPLKYLCISYVSAVHSVLTVEWAELSDHCEGVRLRALGTKLV